MPARVCVRVPSVVQVCKPKDFAGQMNLSMEHCWGIVRAVVDLIMRLDDGKFRLIKDPAKELLRCAAVLVIAEGDAVVAQAGGAVSSPAQRAEARRCVGGGACRLYALPAEDEGEGEDGK